MQGLVYDDTFEEGAKQHFASLGEDTDELRRCQPLPNKVYGALCGEGPSNAAFNTVFLNPLNSISSAELMDTAALLYPAGWLRAPTELGLKPDFLWHDQNHPVGEGKRQDNLDPLLYRNMDDLYEDPNSPVKDYVDQLFAYMDAYYSYHGFLTSYACTIIVWRRPEEPQKLRFTRAFKSNVLEPTIMQLLHYMLHKEHQMRRDHGKPARTALAKKVQEMEDMRREKEETEKRKRENDLARNARMKRREGEPEGGVSAGGQDLLADLPLFHIEDLNLSECLAATEAGPVMLGRIANAECAIKAIDVDKEDRDPLCREAYFLKKLHDLDCVVDLVEIGRTWHGASLFLATSHVKGRALKADGSEPTQVQDSARAGLAAIHARTVMHGDVRPANMIVTPEEQVIFIDFGRAEVLEDVAAAERERQKLENLLQGRS